MYKKKALFVPDWRNGNPYLDLLSQSVASSGYVIVYANYPRGMFKLFKLARKNQGLRAMHVHWIGGLVRDLLWSSSVWSFRFKLILFALDIVACRSMGIKIVWTIHNLVEHESPDPKRELVFRRWFFNLSSSVIVHSQEALARVRSAYVVNRAKNVFVIPHGNYLSVYPVPADDGRTLAEDLGLTVADTVLLFFGAIRKYKGLETLVRQLLASAKLKHVRLVIAGRVGDEQLASWIAAQAVNDHRIIPRFGFISDDQLAAYFCISDIVVLPFERTLSSGSVVLAMTMGKALLLPAEAAVLGVPGAEGAYYYRNATELTAILSRLNKAELSERGDFNLRLAKRADWKGIGLQTARCYE